MTDLDSLINYLETRFPDKKQLPKTILDTSYFKDEEIKLILGRPIWQTSYALYEDDSIFNYSMDLKPTMIIIDKSCEEAVKQADSYGGRKIKILKDHTKRLNEKDKMVKSGVISLHTQHQTSRVFETEEEAWEFYHYLKGMNYLSKLYEAKRVMELTQELIDEIKSK